MLDVPINITTKPGVYIFRQDSRVLYVGKAANLKKRLSFYYLWQNTSRLCREDECQPVAKSRRKPGRSGGDNSDVSPISGRYSGRIPEYRAASCAVGYFRKNISGKVKQLLQEATSLDWIETSSEIEAFLKEAELIKKYKPKYNIVLRDDKNYFYVGITKEKFPRIFITHQPTKNQKSEIKNPRYIGPFTSGAALKTTLKFIRRVFPYCICKKFHKRKCLSAQIGRCFGYCCVKSAKRKTQSAKRDEYQKNIKNVAGILNGRSKKLAKSLKKEMKAAAKNQDFEKAAKLRNQILGLENIFQHRPSFAPSLAWYMYQAKLGAKFGTSWTKIERNLGMVLGTRRKIFRVEGYDISNLLGREATGSMVVFLEGKPAKEEYRKFRIKTVRGINDVDMLKEVVGRRLNHPEWPYPDLMLIDGGKAHFNATVAALKFSIFKIRPLGEFTGHARQKQKHLLLAQFSKPLVAALAKREEELYIEGRNKPTKLNNLPPPTAFFLQHVRDEAHRFAKKYHHTLRKKSLVDS